jgi:hypothetical protein
MEYDSYETLVAQHEDMYYHEGVLHYRAGESANGVSENVMAKSESPSMHSDGHSPSHQDSNCRWEQQGNSTNKSLRNSKEYAQVDLALCEVDDDLGPEEKGYTSF